jgi:hypothetical protein
VEVLERIGTQEARQWLSKLAEGERKEVLIREARGARNRLRKKAD